MSRTMKMSRRKFIGATGAAGATAAALGTGMLSSLRLTFAAESEDLLSIAQDAYIWGYPLVLTQQYLEIARQKHVPVNRFTGKQHLSKPSDRIVGPNIDTLYGYSWIDLTKEPLLLHVPDTNDRYYSIQLIDAYQNSYAYVGRRATGTKEGIFALVGPDWKGRLPGGVRPIQSPTNLGLAFTRTLVQGDADLPAAQEIQRQYALAALSAYPNIKPPAELADSDISLFPTLHPDSLGLQYFDTLSAALISAPPPEEDNSKLAQFAKAGIAPAKRPSQAQDAALLAALHQAIPAANERIVKADFSTAANGWSTNYKVTNFIKDPLLRASVNRYGPATHIAKEALYFGARPNGEGLSGANKYLLRFPHGQLPPVDAFWSLTLYGEDLFLVENPIHRYSIGDRTAGLVYGSDGSLEIHVQAERPAQGASNWLPSPTGPYELVLRTYQPRPAIFDGSYKIPSLQKI
jgi:hypothetical protein